MMMGGAAAAVAAASPLAQGGGGGAAAAVNKIERAHQMYREGQHEEALDLYTEALSMAKTKPQKIALHSNRAACYLKLHDFKKAAEECTLVLELDHKHTGALMLRAQTLVTLKEYNSALFDVNRLMELNPSSDVYQSLQARLKTQLSLAPIPECEEESLGSELEDDDIDDEEVEERKENLTIALADNEDASRTIPNPVASASQTHSFEDVSNSHFKESEAILTLVDTKSVVAVTDQKLEVIGASNPEASASETHNFKDLTNAYSKGWEAISNPSVQCKPTIPAQKKEATGTMPNTEAPTSQKPGSNDLPNVHSKGREPIQKPMGYSRPMASLSAKVTSTVSVTEGPASHKQQSIKDLPDIHSKGWQAIPQPKGHSKLDYSRWNRVEDDSSEDEDEDEEEALPRYRFRVKTVGVRPVK